MARGTQPGAKVQPFAHGSLGWMEIQFESALTRLSIEYGKLLGPSLAWGQRVIPSFPIPVSTLYDYGAKLGRLSKLGRAIRHPVHASFQRLPRQLLIPIHPWELLERDLFCRFMPLGRMAHNVLLDVPETPLLATVPDLDRRILDLRNLGFRICASGVGFDYARENYLWLPDMDYMRLSPECVEGLHQSTDKQTRLTQLIELAHSYGCSVIATDVTAGATLRILRQLGCDIVEAPSNGLS